MSWPLNHDYISIGKSVFKKISKICLVRGVGPPYKGFWWYCSTLISSIICGVDDLRHADELVASQLLTGVDDVALCEHPGDRGVVDIPGLHRREHGDPDVLQV